MAKKKKRVEKEAINIPTPKKRPKPKAEVKNKPSDDKYIRLAENSNIEKFKAFSERIQRGELSRAYYAIDGDKGYFYYLVLKNKE